MQELERQKKEEEATHENLEFPLNKIVKYYANMHLLRFSFLIQTTPRIEYRQNI
jgi:hypothetical protein